MTAPVKVAPPELVMVRVPMFVPIVPTETIPVVLIIKLAVPLAGPVIEVIVSALAIPVPMVSIVPVAKVIAPTVIAPVELPPMRVVAVVVSAAAPKLITPVPLAAIVPAKLILLGAVATNPPVYVWVPNADPKAKVPVLRKETALVMVVPVAFRPKL